MVRSSTGGDSPLTVMDSKILSEVYGIPAIYSIFDFYERTKNSNSLVFHGFTFAEKGFGFIARSCYLDKFAGCPVDNAVAEKLADLKESYPILQKRPKSILKKTQKNSVKYVKSKTRSALDNKVGKTFVQGLDVAVSASNRTLKFLEPSKTSGQRRNYDNLYEESIQTSEKHVQTEETNGTSKKGLKNANNEAAETAWINKIMEDRYDWYEQVLLVLLFPLRMLVKMLKATQKFVHPPGFTTPGSKRRISKRNAMSKTLSPEQIAEIGARRKVSPKKRLHSTSSFLGNLKSATFRMLGFQSVTSHVKQTDIRQFMTCSKHKDLNECPVLSGDEKEKKRKHPGHSEGSDSDEDLINMDLKYYVSDEDPDYEPSEDSEDTDCTIESQDEETESDLEIEEAEGRYMQLKDKPVKNGVSTDKNDNKNVEKVKIPGDTMKSSLQKETVTSKASPMKSKASPMKSVASTAKTTQSAPVATTQSPGSTQSAPGQTSIIPTKTIQSSPSVTQAKCTTNTSQQSKIPSSQHVK